MNYDFTITLLNILSVREDKLTILLPGRRKTAATYGKHVWVVSAGAQPRAWCKRDTPKGGHPAVWREARFHCDALLVPPDTCHAARRKIVTSLRAALAWDHTPRPCPSPFDANEREFVIVLARARRRIKELRDAGAFAGLTANEAKTWMEEIRTECGLHEIRRGWTDDEPEDNRLNREWNECDPLRRIWETYGEFQRLAETPGEMFVHRLWGNHDEMTTLEQVTGEAVTMFHCLDTYIGGMAEGRYFAYAVRLDDERATLGLRKEGGRWLIDQLQGPANAKVSPALRKQVADWLAAKATNIPAMQQAQAA